MAQGDDFRGTHWDLSKLLGRCLLVSPELSRFSPLPSFPAAPSASNTLSHLTDSFSGPRSKVASWNSQHSPFSPLARAFSGRAERRQFVDPPEARDVSLAITFRLTQESTES